MDTKTIFPIKTHIHTNHATNKVTIIQTRQGSYNGRRWTDADINLYESLNVIKTNLVNELALDEQKEMQHQIEALCDDSFELV